MTVNQYELEQMIVEHKNKAKEAENHHDFVHHSKKNEQSRDSLDQLRMNRELKSKFL